MLPPHIRPKFLGVTLILAVAASCAQSGDEAQPAGSPSPAEALSPELIAQGQEIYSGVGNCGICHGPAADGGRFGPSLSDGSWIWFDSDSPTLLEDVATLIREGIPVPREYDAPMPPMGGGSLTDDQIHALAVYLVSLN